MHYHGDKRALISDDAGNRAPTVYRLAFVSLSNHRNFHGFGRHYDSMKAARDAAPAINAERVQARKRPATHVMVIPPGTEYDVTGTVESDHTHVRFESLNSDNKQKGMGSACV